MPVILSSLLVLPSPIFSVAFERRIRTSHSNVAFEHHIFSHFPCIRALFLSPPAIHSYQTTHVLRWSYLNICDRRLINVSSLCMGCPSASLPIGDRGAAPHILRCRRNVSQCSVPTNIILCPYSPLLWAMNVPRQKKDDTHGEELQEKERCVPSAGTMA